jgi:hypothetical protein
VPKKEKKKKDLMQLNTELCILLYTLYHSLSLWWVPRQLHFQQTPQTAPCPAMADVFPVESLKSWALVSLFLSTNLIMVKVWPRAVS